MYCQCGCGGVTTIAKCSSAPRGDVRGQHVRFIRGHYRRKHPMRGSDNPRWVGGKFTQDTGYVYVQSQHHPRATRKGYVREHILVAEKALGRVLPDGVIVHHVNQIRDDNKNRNLVICENSTYHKLLHQRQRAHDAGAPAHWLKCWLCKAYDDPKVLQKYSGQCPVHAACNSDRAKAIYIAKVTKLKRESMTT